MGHVSRISHRHGDPRLDNAPSNRPRAKVEPWAWNAERKSEGKRALRGHPLTPGIPGRLEAESHQDGVQGRSADDRRARVAVKTEVNQYSQEYYYNNLHE